MYSLQYFFKLIILFYNNGFIVGNNSTSLIEAESVSNIINLSIPIPNPPVGGRPISKAVTKSSSIIFASSSPASLASTCFLNLSY